MKKIYNLSKEPESLLCDLINRTNNTEFDSSHFLFSSPYFNGVDGRCTVTVTPNEHSNINGKMLKGSVTVDYKRLNLTYFFASRPVLLLITREDVDENDITADIILSVLFEQMGLFFRIDEVYVSFIKQSDPEDPDRERTYFTITPKPTHLVWEGTLVGEYTIAANTSDHITTTSLDGLNDPVGLSDTTFPLEYLYYGLIDGTPYVDTLLNFNQGFVFNEQSNDPVWLLGQNLTGDIWSYVDTPTETYNIFNAVVEYNGINDGEWGVNESQFTNMLVIKLDEDYNTRVAGHLVIPYTV